MPRSPLLMLLIVWTIPHASADVIFTDNFERPDGNLTDSPLWTAFAGAGNNPVQILSGAAIISHGSGSREDVSRSFSSVTSGSIYAGFDFSVEDLGAPYSGTNNQYFAQFNESGARGRMDIVSSGGSGDYAVGIATNSAAADAVWGTGLSFDTVYRAVIGFDIDNDQAQLWINPTSPLSTSILGADLSGATSITEFAFRQADSSEDEMLTVDRLTVATTFDEAAGASPAGVPEPSITLLMGLAAAGLCIRQRIGRRHRS